MIIQPFYSLLVFVTSTLYNPNNDFGILAGCISDNLTEVVVVGVLQLVFNDDFPTCTFFCSENVYTEFAPLR